MGETLLIVDDHDGFRACARRTLEADGFEVVASSRDLGDLAGALGDSPTRGFIAKSELCGDAIRRLVS